MLSKPRAPRQRDAPRAGAVLAISRRRARRRATASWRIARQRDSSSRWRDYRASVRQSALVEFCAGAPDFALVELCASAPDFAPAHGSSVAMYSSSACLYEP